MARSINPQVKKRLDALLRALRSEKPNLELIAQRARLVMGLAPSNVDRIEWLHNLLTEEWQVDRVTEALAADSVGVAACAATSDATPEPREGRPGRGRHRSRPAR